jgi:hypothetical protein
LLEDLWVSGAKAVSAAGAALDAGAEAVAILPLCREYRFPSQFTPEEYAAEAAKKFDIASWPR